MKTVKEVSDLSGVSVRTLHHYDSIGLLKPTAVTGAGYRLYDDTAIARLQTILLFRELKFPLKEIAAILDSENFSREQALKQQIDLLELERRRLGELISFAREILVTGVNQMDFSAFDKTEIERYKQEAKQRWGTTGAYREYEQKTAPLTDREEQNASDQLMRIFVEMGQIKHLAPDSERAQASVEALRQCITDRYYTCTVPILAALGQMYTQDERFRATIDSSGGEGTAEFAGRAIEIYCAHSGGQ